MPPSPAFRYSPGRETRTGNHKRGHSLEGGSFLKEKDDDLALFNEMQTRERDTFLLQSTDEFDDSLSMKLRYFSDFKLGISIPARGESSDLLNGDGDKNDYDWLLTPPDTPLFPSLDDETPTVLACRGRPRSQPISISRSTTIEKSYRTSRSSASPHHLSPSPRSGNGTFQSRGRASSAPHSSPTPSLRSTTPSRRPSTPPSKPSTPALRSSTPTPRRMSSGSSGTLASSGTRGTSPIKASRGNSASPKLRAWQSNLLGFSSDAPPNLRTSLGDRPASYVRGSSPASRNGKDPSSKIRRQSMSPTASRSASSTYSHDRDRLSSYSKGSVASSGDDDVDSLLSAPVDISDRSAAIKAKAFPSSRAVAFSKKTATRTVSSSSAPKRFFDSAIRQMDHRKSPQNMFRPLLSSVPSTTFYVGKANSAHRSMISRNSSLTTSSNASSEHGASVAPDTEGSDHDQDEMASEWGRGPHPGAQDDLFLADKMDDISEDTRHETYDGKPDAGHIDSDVGSAMGVNKSESDKVSGCSVVAEIATSASDILFVNNTQMAFDGHENFLSCSNCGRKFTVDKMEGNDNLCPDCSDKGERLAPSLPTTTVIDIRIPSIHSDIALEEDKSFCKSEALIGAPETPEVTSESEVIYAQCEINVEQDQRCNVDQKQPCLPDSSFVRSVEEESQHLGKQLVDDQSEVGPRQSERDIAYHQSQHFNAHASLTVDVSEGAGIPLLLKSSSSSKWPVLQGRTFTATNIPCDGPSYARDSMTTVRSSFGHGSASTSSSVDWSSSKPTESRVQRQSSIKMVELDNSRDGLSTKPQSTASSGTLSNAYQALILAKNRSAENLDVSFGNMEYDASEETPLVTEEKDRVLNMIKVDGRDSTFIGAAVLEEDKHNLGETCRVLDTSASELSSQTVSMQLEETAVASFQNDEQCVSFENGEDPRVGVSDIEVPGMASQSTSIVEDTVMKSSILGIEDIEAPMHNSSLFMSGEVENCHVSSASQTDCATSPKSNGIMDDLEDPSVLTTLEKDVSVSGIKSNISDQTHEILEDSNIVVEGLTRQGSRSLTLEEATDTILFCSSIIHNLAYQAATIAIERENPVALEGSRPTITIPDNSNHDRKDPRGRPGAKRNLKSHKTRQKRVETDTEILSTKTEADLKNFECSTDEAWVPNKIDSEKPPKLESKCNCTVM